MDFYLLGEVVQEVVHRELLSLLQDFVVLAGIWPGKEGTQEKNKGVRRRREGFKKKKSSSLARRVTRSLLYKFSTITIYFFIFGRWR